MQTNTTRTQMKKRLEKFRLKKDQEINLKETVEAKKLRRTSQELELISKPKKLKKYNLVKTLQKMILLKRSDLKIGKAKYPPKINNSSSQGRTTNFKELDSEKDKENPFPNDNKHLPMNKKVLKK